MNHYWSCWFTKDQLKAAGAIDIHPAAFAMTGLVPYQPQGYEDHWVFKADESFATFAKITNDKSVVCISTRYFKALCRSEYVSIGQGTKTYRLLNDCSLDF